MPLNENYRIRQFEIVRKNSAQYYDENYLISCHWIGDPMAIQELIRTSD